jgi:hypothetical protein
VGRRARLGGLLLLLLLPELLRHVAGEMVGYADLPLAVLFLFAAIFFYRWLKHPTPGDFSAAALFFSLAGTAKNEGLILSGAGLVLLLGCAAARRRLSWPEFATAVLAAGLILLPWQVQRTALGIAGDFHPTLGAIATQAPARIGPILAALTGTLADPGRFNVAILLVPLLGGAALVYEPRRWRATLPLLALIGAHLGAAIIAFTVTPFDLAWHLSTSADRILFQSMLVALFLATIYMGLLLDRPDLRVPRRGEGADQVGVSAR